MNVGARSDIAHRYSDWLMRRLREGYALVRNPVIPSKVHRYQLTPDVVDCLILCTKDPLPMLAHLDELDRLGLSTLFFVTVTSYGADVEPGVRDYHCVMETFAQLSEALGRSRVVWRYDPIFVTERYTVEHHLSCFSDMAKYLASYTDTCVFSFVEMYKKLAENFPELRAVRPGEKQALLAGLSDIARAHGLHLQTCGDARSYEEYGIVRSGCVTAKLMERVLGRSLRPMRAKPTRPGCGCVPTKDIGAYDSCPNGCRYCYANFDHALAARNYAAHDPASPLLIGHLQPTDKVVAARQESMLMPYMQMGLF